MGTHAFLSASGAPAWIRCNAKPHRESGLPDVSSPFAIEGTAAHKLLELCLKNRTRLPDTYLADYITLDDGSAWKVDEEMVSSISETLAIIDTIPGVVYAEQRLDISCITGENGAKGTSDVVIVSDKRITIIDLKYGKGIPVDAVGNEQLLIYAGATSQEFDLIGDIAEICIIIHQPRINNTSEWVLTNDELWAYLEPVSHAAKVIMMTTPDKLKAEPGVKQCQFCKVKLSGGCPEYLNYAPQVITGQIVNLDRSDDFLDKVGKAEKQLRISDDKHLATCMDSVELIEQWCSAVRKEVAARLHDGAFTDKRYKLVRGRPGNKKYIDIQAFKNEISDLISVESITEEVVKSPAVLSKEWKKHPELLDILNKHVIRTDGQPTVAHISDRREAIDNALDFIDMEDTEFNESLLGLRHDPL
jgi:hypothetical protein